MSQKNLMKSEFRKFTLMKNTLNYFWYNAFGKLKNLANLPITLKSNSIAFNFNQYFEVIQDLILFPYYSGYNLNLKSHQTAKSNFFIRTCKLTLRLMINGATTFF
jgi:hypothetical protein